MSVIVQKYGGSSVADAQKIRGVAEKIAARRREGDALVVVVSAMGDTTDELLSLARQVTENPSRRELDMLLTAGERISMALLSMALNALDVPAISFTGSQSGIITTDSHTNARILEVRPTRIQEELAKGRVVIVAGYQGVSASREVTTLGRGGSDTTAVALAAALDAAACEIYSDVDGVFSADPRVVPQALRLAEISYEEMQALAESGAKVLNAQAVEFARRAGITIHARATAGGEGTRVTRGQCRNEGSMGSMGSMGSVGGPARSDTSHTSHTSHTPSPPPVRVSGVTGQGELALLRLRAAGRLEELLEILDGAGAPAREVISDARAASLVLSLENVHGFPALRTAFRERFGSDLACQEGLGAVCIVGPGIEADNTLLRRTLAALSELDVPVEGVHTAPLRLLALVPADRVNDCVRRLHREFVG